MSYYYYISEKYCPICYSNDCRDEVISTTECEHKFCYHCFYKYLSGKIEEREPKFFCPIDGCNNIISAENIRATLENYCDQENLKLFEELNSIYGSSKSNFSMCNNCDYVNEFEKDSTLCVECYNCSDCYCRTCGECLNSETCSNDQHMDMYNNSYLRVCPNKDKVESEFLEIKEAIEEDIYSSVKACPVCRIIIEKDYGCSAMKCQKCKIKFCWDCLKINSEIMEGINNNRKHTCEDFVKYISTDSDDEYLDTF